MNGNDNGEWRAMCSKFISKMGVLIIAAAMLAGCGAVQPSALSFIEPCASAIYRAWLWSPDGMHIAYAEMLPYRFVRIQVMNPDGTGSRPLSDRLTGFHVQLKWLPDSRALEYSVDHKVAIAALDDPVREINIPIRDATWFEFSPNGQTVAYELGAVDDNAGTKIPGFGLATIDGTTLIEHADGTKQFGAWSPTGEQIVFIDHSGIRPTVSTMNLDGSNQRQLVRGASPIWSPDGQWISYRGLARGYKFEGDFLFVMASDGTDMRLLTDDIHLFGYSWLPDSEHIAYQSKFGNNLRIINIHTLTKETLTSLDVELVTPASWSPDGKQAVFGAADPNGGIVDIYVINRDGTGLKRLTDNPGNYQCFKWPF